MTFTFIKKHIYFSGSLGLVLLVSLVVTPFLLNADTRDREPRCPSYDRDCDGFQNRVPPGCNVCSAFDIDMDDNDPNIPSVVGPFLN